MSLNSFNSRSSLKVGNKEYEIYRLDALDKQGISTKHLPFSLRILLENLLRTEDGRNVKKEDIHSMAAWNKNSKPDKEIAFTPSRVLLQDFTGVPCVVDLAAMRDAMQQLGGDPALINPLQPVELVIDHSVQVDEFGTASAFDMNALLEFQRNKERYSFLRWGQTGFRNLAIVPPDTGIVHQVNLEYLARVIFVQESNAHPIAYPDTLVGTDSHTTMINGLGVLGWGVGGIEAEAAMLGQPVSMLIPLVVGVKLTGRLREGATATDLVLTITEMLRKHGVVGKFVEYFGPGLRDLPLADRATIANMSPEYGATCGIFPVDKESLKYLKLSGRSAEQIALVEAYCREQGLFHDDKTPEAEYSELLSLDLATVEPSLAGPKRPQDRVVLSQAGESFNKALPSLIKPKSAATAANIGAPAANGTSDRQRQMGAGRRQPRRHRRRRSQRTRTCSREREKFSQTRQRRDRRHHLMHQHFKSVGHDRRRPAREESSRERFTSSALGEDFARARLQSCSRLSRERRPHSVSRKIKIPHCRLRMHYLHRQLRTAAHGSFTSHRRKRSGRCQRSLRQSQLRRPHQLRSPRELFNVSAAGCRLCACRTHRHRPSQRRHRQW